MGSIAFHLQGIFRIFDYLTMKTVAPASLTFHLPQGIKVLSKGDGYFVLVGNYRPLHITIESPIYESMEVLVPEDRDKEQYLWMKTKSRDCVKLTIQAKPHSHYFAYLPQEIRLKESKLEEDAFFLLFTEEKTPLIGRKFLLHQGEEGDIVEILAQEDEAYLIENNHKAYPKIKTKLAILFEGTAEENGLCTIPVPQEDSYIILDEKGKKVVV